MDTLINQMVKAYNAKTIYDQKNAIKEVIQEIVLCGLSRSGFFRTAAFYGGTALRIFYGLDRFSEDLDFSLAVKNESFDITTYFPILEKEVKAFGLHVEIVERKKVRDSHIQSAFLKGNTKEHLLLFYPNESNFADIASNELIKIKFEVDVNPPPFANFERKYRLQPVPYEVNLYDESSLFAGKLHAVLGRSWKNRIKGRDLYDYVFYLSRGAIVNLQHLRARLMQSGHVTEQDNLSIDLVKQMLCERFNMMNFEQAKRDVLPFIHDTSVLSLWSTDFFTQITENLRGK